MFEMRPCLKAATSSEVAGWKRAVTMLVIFEIMCDNDTVCQMFLLIFDFGKRGALFPVRSGPKTRTKFSEMMVIFLKKCFVTYATQKYWVQKRGYS